MAEKSDSFFMARAIELAKLAWGQTHPNPMVGAVIVKNGKIIAEGYHKKDGEAHAEINAIANLAESAEGAEIYVSLEPCSTTGRTGACSDAIIANKFSRVIVGARDPNPAHSGRAFQKFAENGIDCVCGVLERECENLNFIFNHAITKNEALLAMKVAQTQNGKIAEIRGKPSEITGPEARDHAMLYRKLFPAIGVGFGTLVADNPSLTRRGGEEETSPARLLFDRSLNSADIKRSDYKLFSDKFAAKTYIVCDADSPAEKLEILKSQSIKIIQINSARADEKSFWSALKSELLKMGINGLIVEGGAKLLSSIADANAADYMFEYTSPKIFPDSALGAFCGTIPVIENPQTEKLGEDVCRRGKIKKI